MLLSKVNDTEIVNGTYIIPEWVTEIGVYAFGGRTSLKSIVIPDGVTEICDAAFSGCISLSSIVIPDGVTEICDAAFSGCISLSSIVIPDGVTEIDRWVFSVCRALSSIVIPDSVTAIRYGAFSGCISLESVVIPDGVTKIAAMAFYDCSSLESIVIPDGVTEISNCAFRRCTSLECVTIKGVKYDTIYSDGDVMLKAGPSHTLTDGTIIHNCYWISEQPQSDPCIIAQNGDTYAHGDDVKSAVRDLKFKLAENRGAEQYKNLTPDTVLTIDEAISAYHVITGSCIAGINHFIDENGITNESLSVNEIIKMTENAYRGNVFKEFITSNNKGA